MTRGSGRWLELAVRSRTPLTEEGGIAHGLIALGGRAVEEREGWWVTHLEEPADLQALLERAREILARTSGGGAFEVVTGWRDDEDWSELWKRGLTPRRITDRIVVTTTWQPLVEEKGEIVLVIDPGMAFGTAEHGTTRGCLRLLDKKVSQGERVGDVGAGSGILSIAAARLGAAQVLAVEGDPLAVETLTENVDSNGVGDVVRILPGWADAAELRALGPFDGMVSNIETRVLGGLLPGFTAGVRPGGWLILSGILAEEWPGFRGTAEAAGFRLEEVDEDEMWRTAAFRRE